MMDGITLHSVHNPKLLPDHIKQVADMVRSLSNKYAPTPSLDKIEIDLLNGLKDFCHCTQKKAATVKLCKTTSAIPMIRASGQPESSHSPININSDSWHKPPEYVEENDR